MQSLRHVLRKEELENVALMGKVEGKRDKLSFISSLCHWLKISENELRRIANDRKLCRIKATNVLAEQGTLSKRDRQTDRERERDADVVNIFDIPDKE